MIVKRAIIILLGLLFIIGPVTAYYASSTSFLPSDPTKTWIIADVGQQNVIKIVVTNSTYGPIKDAPVTFTLDNSLLGTINPLSTLTDINGEALCTFRVNSTHPYSGTAIITANVTSTEDSTGATYYSIQSYPQNIDHNVPYKTVFVYSNEVAVESVLPVKISVFDRWDNRIDNKRPEPAHSITLHVNGPSPPNDCGFTDFGLVHDKNFDLDLNGEVNFKITPATRPGWHYILLDPMGSIPEQMKMFNTMANGIPFAMTQSFNPDGIPYATVLADGTSTFTFYYTLYDKYGNPTRNQSVWINTSVPGEEYLRSSLGNGQIWSTYGPKSFTGLFTIDATPVGNSSLKLSKVVRFYNTTPVGLDLTANPQSMPSRDANPSIYSNISAKVTDIMGNGAPGETVTFTFSDVTNTPATATVKIVPSFSSSSTVLTTSAITGSDGYATVKFYPSSYATSNEVGYIQAVTGTAKVTATWKGNQKDEPVTWKNFPYLSAIVSVKPNQVKVGDTVDVSLKLDGDGWALYRYPVDVDLVVDRSTTMLWAMSHDSNPIGTEQTRIDIAQAAAVNFAKNMSTERDRLGLTSFSLPTDVTSDAGLQSPFEPVITQINNLDAAGRMKAGTSLRPGIKMAIDKLVASPNLNSKAVRAIITLTDGGWNYEGSPIAKGTGWSSFPFDLSASLTDKNRDNYIYYSGLGGNTTTGCADCAYNYNLGTGANLGKCCYRYSPYTCYSPPDHCDVSANMCTDGQFTNQNMSVYAKAKGIRLYFIYIGPATADTDVRTALDNMADATGGKFLWASDATSLANAYTQIAGELITEAGVDTLVSVDFGQLIVNNALSAPEEKIFDYVGDPIVESPVKDVDFPTIPPGSTMIDKYNKTPAGQINMHLIPGTDVSTGFPFTDIGPIIINQTTYWNTDPHKQELAFNIGTVNVNESWETNFRLRVLKEGNILVFGPQSEVCFTNGEAGPSCMKLPNLSLSSSMNPLNIGVSDVTLSIVGLSRTDDGTVKGIIPVSWTTIYNGADMITEEVSYIHDTDPPVKFDVKTLNPAFDLVQSQSATLNTEKLPPGGYKIQVRAYTKDASDTKECGPYTFTTQGRAFIKIE